MKDIEQYLRENAPETPDEGQFLLETNARLSAVEGIKNTVDSENRRWRVVLIATLAIGLALGCIVTALVLLYPVNAGDSFLLRTARALQEWKDALLGFVAVCAISLGLLSLRRKRQAF